MSDAPDHTKPLRDSKLYAIARETPLLDMLKSELPHQMIIETEFEDIAPRLPEDGDTTRIFITYRNFNGNMVLLKLMDPQALDRTFDLDHYVAGYQASVGFENLPVDPIETLNIVLLSVLNNAVGTYLGFGLAGGRNTRTILKAKSEILIQAILAVVFNHAFDIYLALGQTGDADQAPNVQGLWAIKSRPVPEPEVLHLQKEAELRTFDGLSTPEEVLAHQFIKDDGVKSTSVIYLGADFTDSMGAPHQDGFRITWEDGSVSEITYSEGESIFIAPKKDLI